MTSWHSYPKVFNLGHRAVRDIFAAPVLIEEKVDGSQFSFGIFDGEIKVKSHRQEFPVDFPPAMFSLACATVQQLAGSGKLHDGWAYRGEVLSKPHHNALTYDHVPPGNLILFDVNSDEETYLPYDALLREGDSLGLLVVPAFPVPKNGVTQELLEELLQHESVLGGTSIEGVVVKSLTMYGEDKKLLMAKHVSSAFKEIMGGEWRKQNPPVLDVISELIERYTAPARYQKAVQHLSEQGLLQDSPQDIGPLIREVQDDWAQECVDEVKAILFSHYRSKIQRGIAGAFPAWYKNELLQKQFAEEQT